MDSDFLKESIKMSLLPSKSEASLGDLPVFSNLSFHGYLIDYPNPKMPPSVIWTNNKSARDEDAALLQYVSSISFPNQNLEQIPSLIHTSFGKSAFFAMSIYVPDAHFLGIARPVALVVTHQDRLLLNSVLFTFKPAFSSILQNLSKLIAATFDFEKERLSMESELLPQGADDLRSITQICDFRRISSSLDSLFSRLPQNQTASNLLNRSFSNENAPHIEFGGLSELGGYPAFADCHLRANYDKEFFKLIDLLDSGAFYFCAFAVFSGQTLVIRSQNTEAAESLARRFSILSPFFKKNFMATFDTATVAQCIQFSIVVLKNVGEGDSSFLSILDLDNRVYKGDSCPPRSVLKTAFVFDEMITETAFVLNCYRVAKSLGASFLTKLAIVSKSGKVTLRSLQKELKKCHFTKDDEPILKYWTYSLFNQHSVRPILTGNRSKYGIAITVL